MHDSLKEALECRVLPMLHRHRLSILLIVGEHLLAIDLNLSLILIVVLSKVEVLVLLDLL
jgi:hypothetical protein